MNYINLGGLKNSQRNPNHVIQAMYRTFYAGPKTGAGRGSLFLAEVHAPMYEIPETGETGLVWRRQEGREEMGI